MAPVPGKREAPPLPTLERAYAGVTLPLARVLPGGAFTGRGLLNAFAALDRLCLHLIAQEHDGALALLEDSALTAVALLFEGHLVSANAERAGETTWGDAALLALMQGYVSGGTLEVLKLERRVVHALSGVGERAWKVQGGEDFSGVRALGNGYATLHFEGEVLGRIQTGARETGAYPAVLRPVRLNLPRIIGAWASERYAFTLRGRDAVNPITDQYNRARATHGKPNVEVLAQLGRGKTPLEVAQTLERDVAGLEGIIEAFLREGLLTHRRDPST
jgi:hypothetical protein